MRSLEHEDLLLEEIGLAQTLGIELEPELSPEPLEIHCEISKGGDLILAKGWVKGKMLLTCDRCAKEFPSPYKSFFEIHYRAQCEQEEDREEDVFPEGEMEIVYFDGDLLDIAEQIRQTVLLSVPMRALCREDCRGLCSGCGRDLNVEDCRCAEPPPDTRWDVLKKLKF
ncbi:MAG TPA: DUF177 domain-containing protein [bacterium]|nr:DUF177 domain-containing protein [bacterium]